MYMRFVPWMIAAAFIFSSCAATETTTDSTQTEDETERVEKSSPEWYDASVSSITDSTSFYGFSHAVSSNRDEAVDLSEEMAVVNLRFEIDRHAEKVRRTLEEEHGSEAYGSSRFIINLRNAIQNLPLESAEFETDMNDDDGVVDAFTRASIAHGTVFDQIASEITDNRFITALRSSSE
jgi:hypothetical protein